MFANKASKIVTTICAVVGVVAFLGIFGLSIAGGSEYSEFVLALIFFAMFLIGSYWWIVFGPGRRL
jgi:ABC-type dipeptide/oligopeptide/nickel transport system permease subunit